MGLTSLEAQFVGGQFGHIAPERRILTHQLNQRLGETMARMVIVPAIWDQLAGSQVFLE